MNPTMNDLIRADLEASDDLEVVMSVVELPAGISLPVHTHPGEEFAYVMEGSVVRGAGFVRSGKSETGEASR